MNANTKAENIANTQQIKIAYVYLAVLLIATFAFGAVHSTTFNLLNFFTFTTLALVNFFYFTSITEIFNKTLNKICISCLLIFLAFLIFQYYYFWSIKTPHPILQNASPYKINFSLYKQIESTLLVICTFILSACLYQKKETAKLMDYGIYLIGIAVAITALAHWFYDNGKLFWTFAPNYLANSDRARWPFVNPNHLAAFLLPIFYLQLEYSHKEKKRLGRHFKELSLSTNSKSKYIKNFFSEANIKQFIKLIYLLLALLVSLLAILASQSRGAWLSLLLGFILYLTLSNLLMKAEVQKIKKHKVKIYKKESTHINKYIKTAFKSNFFKNIIYLVLVLIVVINMLSGRGEELVQNRLDRAIKYSMTDVRRQFYQENRPLFLKHWALGLGFGAWNDNFNSIKSESLANNDPEYLHNDPYEFLTEVGIFGSLSIFALLVFTLYKVFYKLYLKKLSYKAFVGFIGLSSLIGASFVDFHFHIPAILVLFTIMLARFTNALDIVDTPD